MIRSSINLPWGPTKNLSPIGSAVLTFIEYKQTDKQPPRQAKYVFTYLYISRPSSI